MNCYNEILRLKLKYGSGIKLSVDGVELLVDEFLENGILKEFFRNEKLKELLDE